MCDVHVALNCTMCIVVHGLAGAVTALSCEGHTRHTINPLESTLCPQLSFSFL